MVEYKTIVVGELEVNCYLVWSGSSGRCYIIDPGDEGQRIKKIITTLNLVPEAVILTHAHMDHCGGVSLLTSEFGVPLLMHESDVPILNSQVNREISSALGLTASPPPDKNFMEGDILGNQDLKLEVIHTPGHTPGSVCFRTDGILFTGDTLFSGSIGRTDLPGGDFRTMQNSLERLRAFPEDTVILPGHGESTTLKRELSYNPFM